MLFRKREPFYSYERTILNAVVAAAPQPLAQRLMSQIAQIVHVQRSSVSPEINFYANRKGGGWDDNSLLPNRNEVRVADLAVRVDGQSHKGTLYAVSGHIFSLVLRPSVTHPRRAVVDEVSVGLIDVGSLTTGRAAADSGLETAPTSFLEHEVDTEGVPAGQWTALRLDDVYVVSLPDADWTVLAEGPEGRLLLGRRTARGESFCIADIEDDAIQPLAASSWTAARHEAEKGAL